MSHFFRTFDPRRSQHHGEGFRDTTPTFEHDHESPSSGRPESTGTATSYFQIPAHRSSDASIGLDSAAGLTGFAPSSGFRSPSSPRSPLLPVDGFGIYPVLTVPRPVADVILVHGLGGSRIKSWCYNRDPQYFWPSWLPLGNGVLAQVRVFSYGYNSNFKGPDSSERIADFAKNLLHNMLTWYSEGEEGIGTVGA